MSPEKFNKYDPYGESRKVDYCQTCGRFANLKLHDCGMFVCGSCYSRIKPKVVKGQRVYANRGRKVMTDVLPGGR